ncbi:MAG: flagellar basal body-associated protein FliL [Rheinheimera sp.]|uniref:flagellar basal body-associated protein FliL n=1 Tax=Arsukibacterium sp. UBA3155 TaxID=1946058 RepID=UPI000C8C4CEF|nr:flagellar basal body-associated protein FliL [Arsukibacterium sp. UBA3155]MAD75788.1 flagellar basal body-associated protein FliL [Rheinheimera sp.]|tara:strand:+ start:30467 stop:30865 length:399 start_codon:yes stop_codon:yes gene_type:complete
MKFFVFILTALLMVPSAASARQQEAEFVYYGFDPDIVTNYVSGNRRSLGYVRVTVELMVTDKRFLTAIEHHEPLILDTIIGILSKQTEDKVKSLTGREEIRTSILTRLQEVLKKETGDTIIKDLLFTKYLYQ